MGWERNGFFSSANLINRLTLTCGHGRLSPWLTTNCLVAILSTDGQHPLPTGHMTKHRLWHLWTVFSNGFTENSCLFLVFGKTHTESLVCLTTVTKKVIKLSRPHLTIVTTYNSMMGITVVS